ncbi:MAG: HAD family hydrolase [Actinobacteria bacterium]|nr:MAG: HAD family hydrolase [Actinomycetota bacterium]
MTLGVQAVFFDVGNTLLHPYPSVPHVVREILIDEGHVHDLGAIDELMPLVDGFYEDRYREDDTFWTDEDETSQVWVGMYSLLCRRLGIEAEAERIARRVYDEFGDPARWKAYPDVRPGFGRLREKGLRLGIISNWDRRLSGLLAGLELSPLLDVVVSSAEVGLRKPDPRIFELAAEAMDVDPADCVHVGDHHYADIVGATAVGMTPVLIDRHGGATAERGLFIRTLDEIDDVLAGEWS